MAPKAKGKKLTGDEVDDKILDIMQKQNRPFNNTILMAACPGVSKKQIETSLANLAAEGKLSAKEFGKAKLFWIPQDTMPNVTQEEMKELDTKIVELKAEIKGIQEEVSSLESEIKTLGSALTEEEIDARIAELEKENEMFSVNITNLKEKTATIDKSSFDTIQKKLKALQGEWKKRKRLCKDIVDTVSEQSGHKYFAFCDLLELELDPEDLVLKEQQKLANKKKRKTREAPAPKKPPPKKQKKKEEEEEEEEEEVEVEDDEEEEVEIDDDDE